MTEGVGVVELKKMKLNLPDGGLKLAYGGVLKEIEVAYEECGAPLGESNAIYICHALTGDAHVAGIRPGEGKPSGWWEEMVGPGRAFDTNKFHIICANVLGGCTGTTGPMSINPDTGKPYGSSFPQYTFDDAVDVFRMFLKQLGVKKLAALVGGSYGGLQVVNWMTRFPDDMEKSCLIATSASLNTQAIALSVMSRNSITDDPNWKGGDYYLEGDGKGPKAGLAAARQLAHITYLSRELLQQKFGRRLQDNFVNAPAEERAERDRLFKTYFQIESYLDYQAMKFLRRFDANSYLHITRSMDLSDPCDRYGSLDAAFARVNSKVLVVSYENDILFPWWQSKEIVASLLRNKKSVSYCHLESGTGHDSFLTDIEHLSKVVGGFLSERPVKVMKWQERLHRNVLAMVKENSRVIDIGSIPVMVPYGITALLNRFEREHPNVRLHIVEGEADQLKELLRKRQLDLAFIREWDGDVGLDDGDAEFATVDYADDCLAAVLPADHRLASRQSIRLGELANDEFLLLPQGTVMNALITDACAVEGFVPEVRYRGTRAENIIDLVSRGMGVSLLMRTPAAYLTRTAVSIVDLENPIITHIKLYRLRDREPSAAAREFLDFLPLAPHE